MKTLLLNLFALQLLAFTAQASPMGRESGGGDMCEDRIKIIREDLRKWIHEGGHLELTLPAGVEAKDYKSQMLPQLDRASIRCVGPQDKGYPVTYKGVPKTCVFDRTATTSQITCDWQKIGALNESRQYALVHHEYAGLADIEKPNGADSNYYVSDQITTYLADQFVKRLVVKSSQVDVFQYDFNIDTYLNGATWVTEEKGREVNQAFNDELTHHPTASCRFEKNSNGRAPYMETIPTNSLVSPTVIGLGGYYQKNKQYFYYGKIFRDLTVAMIQLNQSGTQIMGIKVIDVEQNTDRKKVNVGTLEKPVYKFAESEWTIKGIRTCTLN